jgi:hypothetical protein
MWNEIGFASCTYIVEIKLKVLYSQTILPRNVYIIKEKMYILINILKILGSIH